MKWRHVWRNLSYFFCLIVLSLFGIIFNTSSSLFVTNVAFMLIVLSLLSLAWPLKKLQIEHSAQQIHAHDSQQPLQLVLQGRGFFPRIVIKSPTEPLLSTIYYGQKTPFTWSQALDRGVYTSMPLAVTASDFFGIAKKSRRLKWHQPLVVGPQIETDFANKIATALVQMVQAAAQDTALTSMDLQSLRNYRVGDPINMIDWKITAKEDNIIIRKNEPEKRVHWQGIFLGEPDDAFEIRLGTFFSLAANTTLWERSLYVTDRIYEAPTWTELAELQASPVALKNLMATSPSPKQPLIIFGSQQLTYDGLKTQFGKTALIYVQVNDQAASIQSARMNLVVARRDEHAQVAS